MNNNQLLEKLENHPAIKNKIIELLKIAEDKANIQTADDIEIAITKEVKGIGRDTIESWANNREKVENKKYIEKGNSKHKKKDSIGSQPMGK